MAVNSGSVALPGVGIGWRQLAGIAGITAVILFVVGIAMQGDAPLPDEAAGDVRTWYEDNGSTYLLGNLVITVGVIFGLVPFFAYLRGVLARAEGGDATWSRVSYLGSVLFLVMGGVSSSFLTVLATDAAAFEEDSVVIALQYLSFGSSAAVPVVAIPFFLGTAFVIIRTKVFAGWIAWLCLLAAALGTLSLGSLMDVSEIGVFAVLGYLSVMGLGLVVLALGVSLLRGSDEG